MEILLRIMGVGFYEMISRIERFHKAAGLNHGAAGNPCLKQEKMLQDSLAVDMR